MPSSSERDPRTVLLVVAYSGMFVLTVGGVLMANDTLMVSALACGAFFISLALRNVGRRNGVVGLILIALGISLAATTGQAGEVLVEGAFKTLPLLVLFGAGLTLRYPAQKSPSMIAIGTWIGTRPRANRFLVMVLSTHAFGWVLNQAAIPLIVGFIRDPAGSVGNQRLMMATLRGFMCAVCWSPMFVGMAIALSLAPGASWLDVAPIGLMTSFIVLATAYVFDHFGPPDAVPIKAPEIAQPIPDVFVPIARVFVLFTVLAGSVIFCREGMGIPIPIAIGLVAPPIALAWRFVAVFRNTGTLRPFLRDMVSIPGSLGTEAVLFLGASVFGIGAAAALDTATVTAAINFIPDSVFLRTVALIVSGVFFCAIGLHPVVFIVLVGSATTPEMLGMSPSLFAGILAIVWGLGIGISPFSATVLQISRFANVSSYRVAWRWNAVFILIVTLLTATALDTFHGAFG